MNIVVTGGSRGIGFGLVKYFLSKGNNVTFTGTKEESLNKARETLNGSFLGVKCDIRNTNDITKLYNEAVNKFGPIDIWINNAGVNQIRNNVSNLDFNDIDTVIDTNCKGVMYATSFVLNKMLKQGFGHIYNMEGLGSDGRIIESTSLYGSSKRLVRYFSKAADKEIKNEKVFVGTLSPGMVLTDLLLKDTKSDVNKIIKILADDVDTVTNYLGKKILEGKKNIFWLTNKKVMYRFIKSVFIKK